MDILRGVRERKATCCFKYYVSKVKELRFVLGEL